MRHAAIVIPGIDRLGGAERQAMLLAVALCRRGWRVTTVALSGTGGTAAAELRKAGVAFVSLEMRKGLADPRGWIRFHRWLKTNRPDVVHAHLPHATWMARWSRVAAHVPVVVDTLHSSHVGGMGRRIGDHLSRSLPDCVTAVSEATAAAHRAAGMVRAKHLAVMANGIDTKVWRPNTEARLALRRELGVGDQFLWLAVGRLEAVKNYPLLLRAMTGLGERSRLVVLGDGPLRGELTGLAAQLGLRGRIHFAGFETNVPRWMQAADGFVLSSRYEGLPMAVLEAGACGLPAVATDVAGTREAIVAGETGLLAHADDAGALGAAMNQVMRMMPERRQAMGTRARQHVVHHFDLEAILDKWEKLYADLLERNSARRTESLIPWASWKRRSATPA